jgi:hypothetical protein
LQLARGIYCHIPDKLYEPCKGKRGSGKTGCGDRAKAFSLYVGSKNQSKVFDYRLEQLFLGGKQKKTGNSVYASQAKESLLKGQSQTQKRRKGVIFSTAGWEEASLPFLELMAHQVLSPHLLKSL